MPSDRDLFWDESPPPADEDLMFGSGMAGSDDPDDDTDWFALQFPQEQPPPAVNNSMHLN